MKLFILTVLILLCCQSFHVVDSSSCTDDLAKLKQNASQFFAQLLTTHQQGQKGLADTSLICVAFFGTQYSFLNLNYASDFNTARCKAYNFAATFPAGSQEEINNINKVKDSCNAILQLSSEFKKNNDLTCRLPLFLNGCEAELNAKRCELSAILIDLCSKGDQVDTLLEECIDGINGLKESVECFASANNLKCDGSSGSDEEFCKLRKSINTFFINLNEDHWGNIHFNFVNVQFIWDQILAKLSDMNLKYVLGC